VVTIKEGIMADKGHCKHGEFILTEGCPQCTAERLGEQLREKLQTNIVKVKYISESTGEIGARAYTYYTEEPLHVGDIITVPVRDTIGKAQVSAVDVSTSEIEAFKDVVKIIPANAKVKEETVGVPNRSVPNETEAVIRVDSGACLAPTKEFNLVLKPEANTEVMAFYNQAVILRDFAKVRVIACNDDLKPANDDLIIIRKVKKAMEEKRKEYLKPFQDHVKETNDAYKTLMAPIEEADKITANKMLTFDAEQKRKIREAEAIETEKMALARREAELKGGEITVDLTPVDKPEAVPEHVRTDMGMTGQRDNWKWEVTDINQVPREYLVINAGMLTPIVKASKGKLTIPGIRIYNEPIIAYHS